ncbi:hypothetical protein BDV59DRAFT_194451 [Aspergillus ambiguus]|uniref:phytanoyl-CoA dioxygenase family protein n=1 Tax=Aspergillus ambiguus TaxID=176160 RepID=UPI003CCD389E
MAPVALGDISNSGESYGDWRDEFYEKGYVVIKGAISPEKAQKYRGKALEWLTSFNKGLDLNDRSTWTQEHLPQSFKAGMYLNYCAAHEKYVWDARQEPGVIEPFAKIWGTDELLVSFDTVNITLPGRKDVEWTPWPHVDQAPERKGLSCVQGIINLSPAGPDDGGLLVMKGSSKLFKEYFTTQPWKRPDDMPARHFDFYPFQEHEVKWFEDRGCELIKVCAEPGDLILWDSRSMHYAAFPNSDTIRTIIYACYTPAKLAKPEDLAYKAELFKKWEATTHWPHCNIWSQGKAMVDGKIDPDERDEPIEKPEITDKLLKLAGVKPY